MGNTILNVLLWTIIVLVTAGVGFLLFKEYQKENPKQIPPMTTTTSNVVNPIINEAATIINSQNLYAAEGWNEINIAHSDWKNSDYELQIVYYSNEKSSRFFVVKYFKEKLGNTFISSNKEPISLALEGFGPTLMLAPNNDFSIGDKILSNDGIIHVITGKLKSGMISINPPIKEDEYLHNFMWINDKNAVVETFEIATK